VAAPSGATTFIVGERPENDDVVTYLTADNVIQRLAKQGDILSAPAQVGADLQKLKYQIIGLKTTCTTQIPIPLTPPPPNDPWGNPYAITYPSGPTAFPIIIGGQIVITTAEYNSLTGQTCL
jgi:hypothetical protein